jgi:hypothetical protein
MTAYSPKDDTRSYQTLDEVLGVPPVSDVPAKQAPAPETPAVTLPAEAVLEVLEKLSPGITAVILETLTADKALLDKIRNGKMDLIDLYKQLESRDRPSVAPTARSANTRDPGEFNAHQLTAQQYDALRQAAHRGMNIRI